jgi:hypothetical protein
MIEDLDQTSSGLIGQTFHVYGGRFNQATAGPMRLGLGNSGLGDLSGQDAEISSGVSYAGTMEATKADI